MSAATVSLQTVLLVIPTMMPSIMGLTTTEGSTARGAYDTKSWKNATEKRTRLWLGIALKMPIPSPLQTDAEEHNKP